MKILIVDDMEENLYLLDTILKSSGYEVVSAKNGIEALERLREDSIDMIISDILMPKMDGFQLCRECKKDESLRKIPFIFYTATYIEEKDKEFALNLGAEKFILKPKEPDEFIKIIQSVLKDAIEGKLVPRNAALEEKKEVFKLYSERLVNKLEKKMLDLEKEIAERKKVEEKIYKANRLYAVLSQVNQTIIRERDKQKLMQDICHIAIEFGKFRLAWIGFVEEKTKSVKPIAYSGEGSDYLKNIKISITDELTGKGPTGRAILERRSIIFNDLENNPDYKPWRKQALEKGYRSSAAFPIWLYNNVIGTLNIYAVEPDFFDKEEIKLLEETALDISFALEKFEEENKHNQVEEMLRISEERWQFALEGSRDGVWDWNAVTNEVFFSRRWKEMLGYNEGEISNHLDEWDKRVHPDDKEQCYADLNKHISGETPFYENEHRVLCKDGSYKWILDRGKVISCTEDNKPLRVIGTHTDITERKQTEAVLKKHQDHLEELVKERTAELEKKNKELKRFNKLFVGREFRIKELKNKVKELEKELRRNK